MFFMCLCKLFFVEKLVSHKVHVNTEFSGNPREYGRLTSYFLYLVTAHSLQSSSSGAGNAEAEFC